MQRNLFKKNNNLHPSESYSHETKSTENSHSPNLPTAKPANAKPIPKSKPNPEKTKNSRPSYQKIKKDTKKKSAHLSMTEQLARLKNLLRHKKEIKSNEQILALTIAYFNWISETQAASSQTFTQEQVIPQTARLIDARLHQERRPQNAVLASLLPGIRLDHYYQKKEEENDFIGKIDMDANQDCDSHKKTIRNFKKKQIRSNIKKHTDELKLIIEKVFKNKFPEKKCKYKIIKIAADIIESLNQQLILLADQGPKESDTETPSNQNSADKSSTEFSLPIQTTTQSSEQKSPQNQQYFLESNTTQTSGLSSSSSSSPLANSTTLTRSSAEFLSPRPIHLAEPFSTPGDTVTQTRSSAQFLSFHPNDLMTPDPSSPGPDSATATTKSRNRLFCSPLLLRRNSKQQGPSLHQLPSPRIDQYSEPSSPVTQASSTPKIQILASPSPLSQNPESPLPLSETLRIHQPSESPLASPPVFPHTKSTIPVKLSFEPFDLDFPYPEEENNEPDLLSPPVSLHATMTASAFSSTSSAFFRKPSIQNIPTEGANNNQQVPADNKINPIPKFKSTD